MHLPLVTHVESVLEEGALSTGLSSPGTLASYPNTENSMYCLPRIAVSYEALQNKLPRYFSVTSWTGVLCRAHSSMG